MSKRYYFLFILAFLGMIWFSMHEPEIIIVEEIAETRADFVMIGVKISMINDGVVDWEMYAKEGDIYKVNSFVTLRDVSGNFFIDDVPSMHLMSPSAEFDSESNEMRMNQAQMTLFTDEVPIFAQANELVWNGSENVLMGTGEVVIFNDAFTVRGQQFRSDVASQKLRIYPNPVAVFKEGGTL